MDGSEGLIRDRARPLRGHLPASRVKRFFTLCPNAVAPSLTWSHALVASGSAALPASFIRSPATLAPSTTVLPTPLAVSLMPSPVVLAPLSARRVASFSFDSSSPYAGTVLASAYTNAKTAAILSVFMACSFHSRIVGESVAFRDVRHHGYQQTHESLHTTRLLLLTGFGRCSLGPGARESRGRLAGIRRAEGWRPARH